MASEAFVFAIPLRARAVSLDWDRVCRLLAGTVDSALNQTDPDVVVVVACHDVPEIQRISDPRVVVLRSTAKLPGDLQEQMWDKHRKKRMVMAHLHAIGGGWVMPLDSDDLVSNRLVADIRRRRPRFGAIIDQGWELDCATRRLRAAPRFNRVCGSSGVFRFGPSELPASADAGSEALSDRFSNHTKWREVAAELGRPLDTLDFRAAVYTVNNRENHSVQAGDVGFKRRLLRLVSPGHRPSTAEIAEFSLGRLLAEG